MNQMLPRPRFWADAAAQIKTRFSPFGEMMIFLLVYLIAFVAQSILMAIPLVAWMMGSQGESLVSALMAGESPQSVASALMDQMPEWMIIVGLFASAAMGAAAVIYCRKFQKRSLASMGLTGSSPLGEYLLGFLLGLVLFGAAAALGLGTGGFRLGESGFDPESLGLVLLALAGCLVYGAGLELMIRGYYAPSLGARAPVTLALMLSTFLPALLQGTGSLFSMSSLNSLLLGLILGVWVIKRGSLWGACAIHGAWTFAQSFLFDVAPAGKHGTIRVFELDADAFRPLLSGGAYGPMESICVTVVLLAGLAAVLALKARDPAPVQTIPFPGPSGPDEQGGNNL